MEEYQKKVVQIGAGKIGRGYVAELFQNAGYEIVFLDYSKELVDALNEQGWYTISKRSADGDFSKTIVRGFQAYNTQDELEQCIEALADTNYVSINVYPDAAKSIGHMIGAAIKRRIENNNFTTMDCIIGVNFLNSSVILHDYAKEMLSTDQELAYLEEKVGFIEGLVGRNGAPPTPEMLEEDPLICNSSDSDAMTIDRDTFKGKPPEGVNFILKENVPAWMVHKIWIANMSHCMKALMGAKKGYTYIGECDADDYIMRCTMLAKKEAEFALHEMYGLSYEAMEEASPSAREQDRLRNKEVLLLNKDTIARVCADMIRKLSKEDRLVGPALAAYQYGRMPYFLVKGIAMGFFYVNPEDATTIEINDYLQENGIEKAITKYCGLSDDVPAEKELKAFVVAAYYDNEEGRDPFTTAY